MSTLKHNGECMREIGSEFWTPYRPAYVAPADGEAYLLSGRTALRYILDDICKNRSIGKVLLPSYCCESMILPFVQSGMDVQFYPVNGNTVDYPYGHNADVVFLIDFFGYVNPLNSEIANREKSAGKIVIYDSTHKIDGNAAVQEHTDYSFCSYRKWFYCNYAKAVKHHGSFCSTEKLIFNQRYTDIRDEAAREKDAYMAGSIREKESFLSKFRDAEQILDEGYRGYAGVPVVFNLREIVSKRRENAMYLIGELKKISQIQLWQDNLGPHDVPLFVPILVDPLIRNDFRGALIKENIYCPIHWPRSPYHGPCDILYDRELSLICDQRYDISDMERMIGVIRNFFADRR